MNSSPLLATTGVWVMQMTCTNSAIFPSFSATLPAVCPLIPESISSKTTVATFSLSNIIPLKAKRSLDSSPPEAVLDKSFISCPAFAEKINLTTSNPFLPISLLSNWTLKFVPFIWRSFNSNLILSSKIKAFSFLKVESFEHNWFKFWRHFSFFASSLFIINSLFSRLSSLSFASCRNFKISVMSAPYFFFKLLIKSRRLSILSSSLSSKSVFLTIPSKTSATSLIS